MVDFVFRNDNKFFLIKHYTALEKLVHLFHMHSIWIQAKPYYSRLVMQNDPKMDKLCKCINDVKLNGIANGMELARKVLNGEKLGTPFNDDCFWWHMITCKNNFKLITQYFEKVKL